MNGIRMPRMGTTSMKTKINSQKGAGASVAIGVIAVVIVVALIYFGLSVKGKSATPPSTSSGGEVTNLAGVTYGVTTDKNAYTANEPINITVSIYNNSDNPQIFSFKNGCQASYEVAGFDLSKHVECLQAQTSFALAPKTSQNVKVVHYPALEKLLVGTHVLTGSIIGYGMATTSIIIK